MNATDHKRNLAIIHLVYGIFSSLMLLLMVFFVVLMLGIGIGTGDGFALIFAAIVGFVVLANVVLTVPSFVAWYSLWKKKSWAKTANIVAAIVEGLNVPVGTAICVYTLWVMLSVDQTPGPLQLPPKPPEWAGTPKQQPEMQYVPPAAPPDWR